MTGNALRILLIDDNDVDVQVVRRRLRRLGLDVSLVRARNGEEACEYLHAPDPRLAREPPSLILSDINMPRMNGFELLERIAGDETLARVPVFVVSTSDGQSDRREAARLGARGYFVKPITEAQLLEALTSAAADDGPARPGPVARRS